MKKTENASKEDRTKPQTSANARAAGLRRIPRRHQTRPGEVTLRDAKVKITMFVDADVLEYFKARAAQPNAAAYQTQMNQALRDSMESRKNLPTKDVEQNTTDALLMALNDERFAPVFGKHIKAYLEANK